MPKESNERMLSAKEVLQIYNTMRTYNRQSGYITLINGTVLFADSPISGGEGNAPVTFEQIKESVDDYVAQGKLVVLKSNAVPQCEQTT